MTNDIQLGDVGIVDGRIGLWCVSGGAKPPENIAPCGHALEEAAEPAEALSIFNGREQAMCWRHEFTPIHLATPEQRERAIPPPIPLEPADVSKSGRAIMMLKARPDMSGVGYVREDGPDGEITLRRIPE